jgi:hypothetical protein
LRRGRIDCAWEVWGWLIRIESVADGGEAELDDTADELRVFEAAGAGGLSEILVAGEGGVGIGFDEDDFVVWGEAQVETGVAVDAEEAIDATAELFDAARDDRIELIGELVPDAPTTAVFFVPFGFVGGDAGFVGWDVLEDEFTEREDLEPDVAEDAEVKFAAFDILFGDGVVVEFFVDELDAFAELEVIFDERGLGDAEGPLFLEGFDEDGELEAARALDAAAAWEDGEVGDADAVIAEYFFGDALVFGEEEAGGTAAGEGYADEFEERGDVLIEPAVIAELVGEVEDDVGFETVEFIAEDVSIVEDGLVLDGPLEGLDGLENVGFGGPIGGLEFGGEVLIRGGGPGGVEEGEDSEIFFHAGTKIICCV